MFQHLYRQKECSEASSKVKHLQLNHYFRLLRSADLRVDLRDLAAMKRDACMLLRHT